MNINIKEIFENVYDNSEPPDLTTFVTHPYALETDIDPVSKIFQTFQSTKSSPAIAIFYFFAIMSHWNLLHGVTYKIPKDFRQHSPNLWLMALAHSGASKSQQLALIDSLLPSDELKSSFKQPASPQSLIAQFAKKPIHLWVEDEAAKYLKQMETFTNPLSPIKGHLLKIKGGDSLTYHSKKDGEVVIKNPKMSVYFVNTILGMINTISEESMYDGFLSRIGLVLSEITEQMQTDIEKNFPEHLHGIGSIENSGLKDDLIKIFEQDIENKEYTFTKEAQATYEATVSSLVFSFKWMQGEKNQYSPFFNRTVLESFKYAIFHHQFKMKEGDVIDGFDVEYGLLVSRYHLCSFARYLQLQAQQKNAVKIPVVEKIKDGIIRRDTGLKDRIQSYLRKKPNASLRDIYRKLTIKKSEAEEILKELNIIL